MELLFDGIALTALLSASLATMLFLKKTVSLEDQKCLASKAATYRYELGNIFQSVESGKI